MEVRQIDLVIIGGGSAGLGAGLSAKENGIDDILIIEKENCLGGILNQCIHNGFGLHTFKEQLSGPEYAEKYIDLIEKNHIKYLLNTFVSEITPNKDIYYSNKEEGFVHIKAKAIIIATGCVERTAGQIMLEGKRISGVLTAGLAQKYLNIDGYMVGKKIFILGSGDIGLIMARRLTLEGAKVMGVAELMPYSNGLQRNIVQCLEDFNIPLYLSHTVKNVIGKTHVEKIVIAEVDKDGKYIPNTEKEFDCDTLILSVGLIPYNTLLNSINVKMSSTKGPIVDENYMTSIEGIFNCGNSLHVHDLVDYVSSEAKQVGESSAKYLKNQIIKDQEITIINPGYLISYIVPQLYHYHNLSETLVLKFRVKQPLKNVTINISLDKIIIRKIKKITILPSEMEIITLKKSELREGKILEIYVEENQ